MSINEQDDHQAATAAGPANDATEFLPPVTRPAPELAWSQDETVEIVYPSWRETYGTAAVITVCCLVAAFVIAVVGWVLLREADPVPPLPPGDATPVLAPAPVTVPPVSSEPTPAPVLKTAEPAPVAAQPPSVTVSPKVVAAPPRPSAAELDERYLAAMTAGGLQITDVHTVLTGARNVCRYLGAGHTEPEAVQVAMGNNASLTDANAHTLVDAAIQVYCPNAK
ncbi:hypothetical protein CKJ65_16425 [Mycobacterium intracellulare]|uniref:DUF732 domain-containing protein n=1 Tax=Mycobacterium intracellulare TaxID=1767 RepID=UPI000BAEC771|nr:DUF732 domain-containing protein [Mycobacterium intracellulare]PBA30565.1 hypothetical protein CKJ65_16425 [Mycobacterium intracellulare]